MEVNCILEENMLKNRLDNINQKYFKCIRLCITSDHNEYNTLFVQNFLSEWEKIFFEPKMRHIREVAAVTKTSAKLSEREIRRSNISQRLQRNMISATTYIPFTWISDYNDSTWNDTESNMTLTNITIVSAKYKNNLIFGYFELYVLILLAIFIILLLITTSIACYYDCENRRITLSGDKYSNIKKSTAPIVTVKHASKQPDNIHERMIPDKAEELSVHSRTLRKRKMLIAARRSTSTQSVTCSEYGDSTLCEKDKLRQLIQQIRAKEDLMKNINAHTVISQIKSSAESKTGDIPEVSSVSDSKSMEKSVTGNDDMEENETKQQ
uniref:Uncharacterized protein n=1 Tax=Wuchereria bancrofti TaxID=6293 RepID=A0AAF5RVQ7_WUCBA